MSSAALIQTLEALIAPGKRARVSPYVELAQIGVLFDISTALVPVAAIEREEFLRTRIGDIAAVARTWEQFKQRRTGFTIPDYASANFRRAYLAYYTTLNVPKVQLVLLDLLRQQALPSKLDVVDVGVGAGTTIVAVLDFLLALWEACALHGVDCPVTEMRVTGLDRDSNLLAISRSLVNAYADVVHRAVAVRPDGPEARVAVWARAAASPERWAAMRFRAVHACDGRDDNTACGRQSHK